MIETGEQGQVNFLLENNARHVWHPMIDPKKSAQNPPVIFTASDGVEVSDIHGNSYLDCTASLWNVNVGHNRPEIKQAIIDQLDKLVYYNTFGNASNPPSIKLSALLAEMLAEEEMVKTVFSSGGSDAVEGALKIARQYWKLVGKPEKSKFFSLKNAYHGVHFGGLSVGGGLPWRRAFEPALPGCFHIDNPYLYRNPWTQHAEELGAICAANLAREIEHQGPDTVAAFIAEPVQGAGGMIVPPANFWPLVRAVCDKYDILLIADEVVTGFGRTGTLFGSRHWGVKPDIMCLAKGINSGYVPLGATMVNKRIEAAWEKDDPMAPLMHGYTYSGHPLACAAALANLAIVLDEDLPANAGAVGAYFLEQLDGLRRHDSVGDVRGVGLMLAIEFVKDRQTKEPYPPFDPYLMAVQKACMEQGVWVRIQANKMIFSPPLVFTRDHVDRAVAAVDAALAKAG
ncbi:MAG: aminotransferase class III-fold pyridoxal phosphate-dependent enzyme [Alphaproteobacteria bacterium]|jgi:putrescine aminotransferase|nr:aminotransferase class III-fold pyridoxal phosphate-dependent enzyme [Alphaproteobacteria bacterium]